MTDQKPQSTGWRIDEEWGGDNLDGVVASERVIMGKRDEYGLADVVAYCFDRETAEIIAAAPRDAARLAAALAVLREVEWVEASMSPSLVCSSCHGDKPTHAPDCKIAALLKG